METDFLFAIITYMKKRKSLRLLICLIMTLCILQPSAAKAEEDFSNTEYWNNLCGNSDSLTDEQMTSCQAYLVYIQNQNTALQQEITQSSDEEDAVSQAVAQAQQQINDMQGQVDSMTAMITDLNDQIEAASAQSEVLQKELEENQQKIEEQEEKVRQLKARVSDRIVEQQSSMRLNQTIEMLFGARNLHDMILIANGLEAISQRDAMTLEELNKAIEELSIMKEQLISDKKELDQLMDELTSARSVLDSQYSQLLSARSSLLQTQANYNAQLTALAQARSNAQGDISANNSAIQEILDNMANQSSPDPDTSGDDSGTAPGTSTPAPSVSTPTPSVSTPTPTPTPAATSSAQNPYWGGWSNCTWGCWQLVYDTLGIALPGWGFSGNWLNDARASGYSTGSDPAVYSIAVYSWHVAFVTAIDGDMVYIKEGNYLGHYGERWVPAHGTLPYSSQQILGYIYL